MKTSDYNYTCTWEEDGKRYRLTVNPGEAEHKCCVSEISPGSWRRQFYSQSPKAKADEIVSEHENYIREVFRLGERRYGKEVVRLMRADLGDESTSIYLEGNQLYIFQCKDYEEIRNYFAMEYMHHTGIFPNEEDLDDYIEYNYYLIPCTDGCIVITDGGMWK